MSEWSDAQAERIRLEGQSITGEQVVRIAAKFRNEIGGVYDYIAAHVENDHPEAL